MQAADLEERTRVDDGLDDRAHAIDLATVARDGRHQEVLAARWVVAGRQARGQLVHGGGQVTEVTTRAFERFLLARHFVVHRTVRRMDAAAAEFLLRQLLARGRDHGRPGDEHLRLAAHQQRVVALHDLGGAEARDRAQAEAHDRHRREVADHVLEARQERHVGVAHRLERLYRTAAAAAFDQADHRQAQFVRHLFGRHLLLDDRGVGRAAAHGEIVAGHDDAAAFDATAAEEEVGRGHRLQCAGFVVGAVARDRADFVEAAGIEQCADALAHRQAAGGALPRNLVRSAHLAGQGLTLPQFFEFGLPGHPGSLTCLRYQTDVRHPSRMDADSRIPERDECVVGNLLRRWAGERPDRHFLEFEDGGAWTFAETLDRVQHAAAGLRSLGVQQGSHVLCWMPNAAEAVLAGSPRTTSAPCTCRSIPVIAGDCCSMPSSCRTPR